MGLRFRKSINLGKGLKLNVGKKGVGLSTGVKGFRYSINSSGHQTKTISLPGTGLSYTSSSGGKKKSKIKTSKTIKSQKELSHITKPGGCLTAACIGIIFIIICVVIAVVISSKSKKETNSVSLKWSRSSLSVDAKIYVPDLYLQVSGKNADEISPTEIKLSNSDICKIEYKSSNHSQIIYEITPIKDGFADITATYNGVTSEPITITIDMSEKVETTTVATTEKETEPPEQTTVTDKQEELVYVTSTGKKYHTKYCRYYNDNCKEMTKEQAEQSGYTACEVCH